MSFKPEFRNLRVHRDWNLFVLRDKNSAPVIPGFWQPAILPSPLSLRPQWITTNGAGEILIGTTTTATPSIKSVDGGASWTLAPFGNQGLKVVYGNGRYAGLAFSRAQFGDLIYSTNGLNWQYAFSPTFLDPGIKPTVVFAFGFFYVFAYNTTSYYRTTATLEPNGFGGFEIKFIYGVANLYAANQGAAYGNNMLVTVGPGRNGDTNIYAQRSIDGINFQLATVPPAFPVFNVQYGNGMFIAFEINNGTNKNRFSYSFDGLVWITGTMPTSRPWENLVYAQGRWIACTRYLTFDPVISNNIATSINGINWTMTSPEKWFTDITGASEIVFDGIGNYFAFRYTANATLVEQHQRSIPGAVIP